MRSLDESDLINDGTFWFCEREEKKSVPTICVLSQIVGGGVVVGAWEDPRLHFSETCDFWPKLRVCLLRSQVWAIFATFVYLKPHYTK